MRITSSNCSDILAKLEQQMQIDSSQQIAASQPSALQLLFTFRQRWQADELQNVIRAIAESIYIGL